MLDAVVGLFAYCKQNGLPIDHELVQNLALQLDVEQMLHVVRCHIGFAHTEILIHHKQELPSNRAIAFGSDGFHLFELCFASKFACSDSGKCCGQLGVQSCTQGGRTGKRKMRFSKLVKRGPLFTHQLDQLEVASGEVEAAITSSTKAIRQAL